MSIVNCGCNVTFCEHTMTAAQRATNTPYLPPVPLPGPFQCPDCGTWWAGFSHGCREGKDKIRKADAARIQGEAE